MFELNSYLNYCCQKNLKNLFRINDNYDCYLSDRKNKIFLFVFIIKKTFNFYVLASNILWSDKKSLPKSYFDFQMSQNNKNLTKKYQFINL